MAEQYVGCKLAVCAPNSARQLCTLGRQWHQSCTRVGGGGCPFYKYPATATNIRIGLCGKMASGKSLVANYLVLKYGFTELAFAARLKEIATEIFSLDVAKKDEQGRLILQQLGHKMREIEPTVWIRYVLRQIPSEGNVVISDVRYPNEFYTLQSLGFHMVRMYMRPEVQRMLVRKNYPGVPEILLDDYSEVALDAFRFDTIISNDKGVPLKSVYGQVDTMLFELRLEVNNE